jgi:DNA-binding helix-hairpin-helix protein with protein kinase domain
LDREARLRVIERQGQELGELGRAYKQCEEERMGLLNVIQQQQERALQRFEQQVSVLQAEIERVQSSREASETARMEALANVDRQTVELMTLTAALEESGAKVTKIEQSNKEMKQVLDQGIFQLIVNRLRGRN